MMRLTTLTAVVMGIALLAGAAASASSPTEPAPEPPTVSKPAAYKHYVACGLSENAKPSHVCQKKRKKGAFFRSNFADVSYTVCVKFPTGKNLCADKQEATKGELYVNKITSNIPGKHKVTWFVAGKRVGLFKFNVPA